ncbi:MAG: cobalamin-independent methionine synthase II family protein [Pseudomonadota bacterium]
MINATKDKPLATTITGSLPRPHWFTHNLQGRPISTAYLGDFQFHEQYHDAVSCCLADQHSAGLDVVTDGDMRFDMDIGGRAWFGYVYDRMTGIEDPALRSLPFGGSPREEQPGDIFHEIMVTRLPPRVTGPVGVGTLEYDFAWKIAQGLSERPVKFGACSAQLVDMLVVNEYYKDRAETIMALSKAKNESYTALAEAGCPIVQIEEPCFHFVEDVEWEVSPELYIEAFNIEVAGLREKTEVWCHTCWGNPFAQNLGYGARYKPVLPYLDQLDVDVITFEMKYADFLELHEVAAAVGKEKKIALGVISHRTLQIETPEEVANDVRRALQVIEPERLILSSDCGFGRQGISRKHAFYKMVAMVRGVNIVRKELGLSETPVLAEQGNLAFL